jgi:hypothetical protein
MMAHMDVSDAEEMGWISIGKVAQLRCGAFISSG